MKPILQPEPLGGYPSEIAVWLWAMEACRQRTKGHLNGIDQAVLDWAGPDGTENSIGSLLYHLAGVEMGWLHNEILERWDLLPEDEFPFEAFTGGRITPVVGVPATEHLARMDRCRTVFLERMKQVTIEDWSRVRHLPNEDYSASPAWVVFHLVEHEAGHSAQIAVMKGRAQAALG